ncbi:MAG: hypothetical protein IKS98_08205 [Lachnospiraceae bacterium]|nr:hypothetical protein [Lachnospiraceae bacterium]
MECEKIILQSERDAAEKKARELSMARNRACALIQDAMARYIKEKTRARSKKAALEKDALIKSPRFKVLDDYDRFEDIQEAYGCDCIDEKERDRLEDLWEEREALKNKTVDGIYQDNVTEALREAYEHTVLLWDEEIDEAYATCREFEKQKREAEINSNAWLERQMAEYNRMFA